MFIVSRPIRCKIKPQDVTATNGKSNKLKGLDNELAFSSTTNPQFYH